MTDVRLTAADELSLKECLQLTAAHPHLFTIKLLHMLLAEVHDDVASRGGYLHSGGDSLTEN